MVVIGAGSAGSVLAAGLSDDPNVSVLLLEAGPDHGTVDAPAGLHALNFFSAVMEPGRIWPGLVATRTAGQSEELYLRGRGAGGSSSVNAMGAIRGTVDDYERWADELGCPGWGWPEMLDAFLRVEDDLDYGGDGLHGKGGPIPLSRTPFEELSPLDRALRAAMAELGYPVCDDYHARDATGVSRAALTLRDGRRVSTNDAYLEPARGRANLDVRGDVLVDRVLFDGRRANGVRTATGEEIAARGDRQRGCDPFARDPLAIGRRGRRRLAGGCEPEGPRRDRGLRDRAEARGTDAVTERAGVQLHVALHVGLADTGPNDMQMIWFGAVGPTEEALAGGRLMGAATRVFSKGEIRLRSADPLIDPVVEFRLLSDDRDRIRLRECVRRMIDIVRHPAVAAISDGVLALATPLDELDTDDAIDAWLTATVNDYLHAVGTCRMGTPGDPAAVVDTDCAVIGYEHLRVCDASVMPDVPKANTHLTTVAIAHRLLAKMQ